MTVLEVSKRARKRARSGGGEGGGKESALLKSFGPRGKIRVSEWKQGSFYLLTIVVCGWHGNLNQPYWAGK